MKVGRNDRTPEGRAYWRFLDETAKEVAGWAPWKKKRNAEACTAVGDVREAVEERELAFQE